MGLLNGRMDNSIYSAVFGKKGPSLGPVSYPVDPPAKAIDEAGSCLMPEERMEADVARVPNCMMV